MLAQRLFLVAGPMRLLDSDFPDLAFMRSIIEHNLNEALSLLPRAAKPAVARRGTERLGPNHETPKRAGD